MFSDLIAFRRDPLAFLLAKSATSAEPMVKLKFGPSRVYLVNSPALAWQVLKSPEATIDKGRLIFKLREVIGINSLTLSGEEHKKRRAAIHRHLTDVMTDRLVSEIAATIRATISTIAKAGEVEIAVPPLTARLSMRVICDLLFGRGTLSSGDESAIIEAIRHVEDDLADSIFRVLPYTPWAYIARRRKLREARATLSFVVERARTQSTSRALIRSLEELGLEGEALRDEILLLIIAGHHTAGSVAAWLIYHMAADRNLAHALAREATQLANASTGLSLAVLKEASLSRACALEALRLYPPAYWMSREIQSATELAGVRLKKGTSLIISPWRFHRAENHWPDPELFNPERNHSGEAYMPFGVGPRACIGARVATVELQMLALELASAFRMKVTSQVPATQPKPSVTLVPSEIKVRFKLREHIRVRSDAA
jgi:cytochrome P450